MIYLVQIYTLVPLARILRRREARNACFFGGLQERDLRVLLAWRATADDRQDGVNTVQGAHEALMVGVVYRPDVDTLRSELRLLRAGEQDDFVGGVLGEEDAEHG